MRERTGDRRAAGRRASYRRDRRRVAGRAAPGRSARASRTVQLPIPVIARSRRQPRLVVCESSRSTRPLATSRAARTSVSALAGARSNDCQQRRRLPGEHRRRRRVAQSARGVSAARAGRRSAAGSQRRARTRSAARMTVQASTSNGSGRPRGAQRRVGRAPPARSAGRSGTRSIEGAQVLVDPRAPGASARSPTQRRRVGCARAPNSTRSADSCATRTSTGCSPACSSRCSTPPRPGQSVEPDAAREPKRPSRSDLDPDLDRAVEAQSPGFAIRWTSTRNERVPANRQRRPRRGGCSPWRAPSDARCGAGRGTIVAAPATKPVAAATAA